MKDAQASGRYRHFRTKNEYEVLCVAIHSETLEELVIYRALYGERKIWARPKDMFYGTVTHEGQVVPRFEKVG